MTRRSRSAITATARVFDRIGTPTKGAPGTTVRLELQADCCAGAWMHHPEETNIGQDVTPADVSDALSAASPVGDDRFQREQSGKVKPDSFTHATSAQRDRWFTAARRTATPPTATRSPPPRCEDWSKIAFVTPDLL